MNCSCLSWGLRAARLVEVEGPGDESDLPPLEQAPPEILCQAEATVVAPSRKKADHSRLSWKVMELSAELAQKSSALTDCQPDVPLEEDVAISTPLPVLIYQ